MCFWCYIRYYLGYMVTKWGIEANTEQIWLIINITSPRCKKDLQKLTRIVALSQFISKSSKRRDNFLNTLRKNTNFIRTKECKEGLQQLKTYLTSASLLSKPHDGKMLFVYLAGSDHAVSTVLVHEKLALALVTTARKLKPYFQSHPITV